MKVQAIFDSVDSAEHALFQLRSMGMEPQNYSITRMDMLGGGNQSSYFPLGTGVSYDNMSNLDGFTGLMGGMWNSVGWNNSISRDELSERSFQDSINREVRLTVECSDKDAIRFRGALVSLQGRKAMVVT